MQRRLLVVDDQKVMTEIVAEIFSGTGVEVLSAVDSAEALTICARECIDVVVTDVMLPGVKGTDLYYALKEKNPFVQIVVMTAYPCKNDVLSMVKNGACDFLLKPFDPEDLRKVVMAAFDRLERWEPLRQECN
jgi:two-component system response regulator HydG